jgi:transposase-like protein
MPSKSLTNSTASSAQKQLKMEYGTLQTAVSMIEAIAPFEQYQELPSISASYYNRLQLASTQTCKILHCSNTIQHSESDRYQLLMKKII